MRVEGHRFGGAYKKKRDVAREVKPTEKEERRERSEREHLLQQTALR